MDEQQYVQNRQTIMKKEKNRLKTKFTINAFEKARAFFRSLDFKHHHRHEQPSTDLLSSSSSNEDNEKKEILLNPIPPTTTISTTRISRVDKLNPRDMIVHRVIHNDNKLPLNYFHQKYKQYLKPSLLIPKQYYNEILNKPYQTYSNTYTRQNLYSRSPVSTLSPSTIPYHIRPFICHEIESSSLLTWNQCVRRLNREYRLTIEALQQAKECLEQLYSNSKSKCLTKKNVNVTFCLPPSSSTIVPDQIESKKIFKPKFVKPVELNTFLSSDLSLDKNEEKFDSIATIIQKFNELNNKEVILDSKENSSQQQEEETTTYTVETFYKNDLSSLLNNDKIVIIQENTTEEEFNLVHQPVLEKSSSVMSKNKSISRIPKRIPTKNNSSNKEKQVLINNNESSNHVKSIVQQINAATSSTRSSNKTLVQRK